MAKKRYFGTDGIRSTVGQPAMNPDFVLHLGWAIGKVFASANSSVLIGKDTRISGYMIESALQAGLSAAGVNVKLLGPLPTPGIAYLTRTLRAQAGIVISASHNAYPDNGIKCFSDQGFKLNDKTELAIEAYMDKRLESVTSEHLGKASRIKDAGGRYIEFCKSTVPLKTRLDGVKIVLDCANGATYHVAPYVFHELGAQVVTIGDEPDGFNINDQCGSTQPGPLQKAVKGTNADLGIAFDGDGDRVIMVDERGELVDGDDILYMLMNYNARHHHLKGGIVGTVMSNQALALACEANAIPFKRTKVGDRHVIETLLAQGWRLGGEPSGHIVNLKKTTSGDGIITALAVLQAMSHDQKPLHTLKAGLNKLPQKLVNIEHSNPVDVVQHAKVQSAIKSVEAHLGHQGRVLLRPSGTEPVVRIMVEAQDKPAIERHIATLEEAVHSASTPSSHQANG